MACSSPLESDGKPDGQQQFLTSTGVKRRRSSEDDGSLGEYATPVRKRAPDMQGIVISLERRLDRWKACTERISTEAPWMTFTRFDASDGQRDEISTSDVTLQWNTAKNVVYQKKRSIRKGWNDLDSYVEQTLRLSPGERGCALSHVRAWRHCLEQANGTEKPLLVLEDDAAPTPVFTTMLCRALANVPSDAHILYLGYSQAAEWRRQVTPEIAECEYVWTTVAYVVWPAAARIMLNRLPIDQPVDNWMANLCAEGHIKSYSVTPKIVLQADAWNVNSDVGHSDEHYWGGNSDILHSDHLYWGETDIASESRRKKHKADGPQFFDLSSDEEECDA